MLRPSLFVSVSLTLCLSAAAQADVISVPGDHSTIQAAIDAAQDGDEVLVAPGTYNELIDFLGKAITLRSSDGAEVTIIDGAGLNDSVVKFVNDEGPDSVLDGFTITGGVGGLVDGLSFGGGMLIDESSPTVVNCTFEANTVLNSGRGGGIAVLSGSPEIRGCTFLNNGNEGITGGAIVTVTSAASIIDCLFDGNIANSGGGIETIGDDTATVINCIFRNHHVIVGGGGAATVNNSASTTFIGCLFTNNSADVEGGALSAVDSGALIVLNSTFVGNDNLPNEGGAIHIRGGAPAALVMNSIFRDNSNQITGAATVSYSNVQGGFEGLGNIDGNPMFVDPLNGDYRLDRCSPSVDAGDNEAVPEDLLTDLDGNPRQVDDPGVPDTGNGSSPIVDMGAYERQEESIHSTIHVPADYATIQEAIDAAVSGCDEVVVAPGTYPELINFNGKAITLRSSDGPDVTIMDGTGLNDSVVKCISGEGPDTVLQGFTVTGGTGDPNHQPGATVGGGMLNDGSSPTVTNCFFVENVVNGPDEDRGGGMFNQDSSPMVRDCIFMANEVGNWGGGMCNISSSPVVINCIFADNTSLSSPAGMENRSGGSPLIINCIFRDNVSGTGAGGAMHISTGTVVTLVGSLQREHHGTREWRGHRHGRWRTHCSPQLHIQLKLGKS